ncbi:hypothetical protein ACMFMF_011409 [Clarireedia jacksonii]
MLNSIVNTFVKGLRDPKLRKEVLARDGATCGSLAKSYEITQRVQRTLELAVQIDKDQEDKLMLARLEELIQKQYGRSALSVLADLDAGRPSGPSRDRKNPYPSSGAEDGKPKVFAFGSPREGLGGSCPAFQKSYVRRSNQRDAGIFPSYWPACLKSGSLPIDAFSGPVPLVISGVILSGSGWLGELWDELLVDVRTWFSVPRWILFSSARKDSSGVWRAAGIIGGGQWNNVDCIQEAGVDSFTDYESETYDNRINYCLVTSPAGRPLCKYYSVRELLEVLYNAIRGYRSLLEDRKILYRDISENNIIITELPAEGDRKGRLIDLDLAKELDSMPSGARYPTGTIQFIAIEVLEGNGYIYQYDLESFFYVFLWICVRQIYCEVGILGHIQKLPI